MDVQSHVHIDGEGLLLLHTCYENRTSHLLPHTNSSLTNTFAIIDLDVLCKLHFKHYKHHHIYIWLWYGPHEKRCCDCVVQKVKKKIQLAYQRSLFIELCCAEPRFCMYSTNYCLFAFIRAPKVAVVYSLTQVRVISTSLISTGNGMRGHLGVV